jgi:G:T-mismatch repair DNA endonuclease (very short patch repair protein)
MWDNRTDEEKNIIIKKVLKRIGRSKGNEELKELMKKENIYDGFVSEDAFHGFVPDEINRQLKIIVEYYGDIYHCNPNRYNNPDQHLSMIGRTVGQQWQRDRIRLATFYKHGYTVVIVWENDFKLLKQKQIERIKDEIDRKKKALGIV